ncbi:4'-phosphopantetheinyl transferase superfamily protein [bacterium]|nr:4'-phosphopantetheinyl transferase superfamily protein [bacterium]
MNQIDVWFARDEDWEHASWDEILSAEEKERRHHFLLEEDRRRYSLSHGMLRTILGRMIGLPGWEVAIQADDQGRPFLVPSSVLDFNLSHTKGLSVLAVVENGRVGVDVERIDRPVATLLGSMSILTGREQADCLSLGEADRARRFLSYWVMKESLLKASGEGLRRPLTEIEFEWSVDRPPIARMGIEAGQAWSWALLESVPGFVIGLSACCREIEIHLKPFVPATLL